MFDKQDITYIDIINAKEESNRTLHKLSKDNMMLGNLITFLEKNTNVDRELISELRKVSDLRGYYAHKFYKEDLYGNHLEKDPLFYKKKINEDVRFVYKVHQKTVKIDEENRYVANEAKKLGL